LIIGYTNLKTSYDTIDSNYTDYVDSIDTYNNNATTILSTGFTH